MSDVSCRGWGDIVTALASIISVITTVMSSSQTLKSAPYLVSCHHSSMLWPALMINIWFGIYKLHKISLSICPSHTWVRINWISS